MNVQTIKAAVSAIVVVAVSVFSAFGIDIDGDALTNVICAVLLVASTIYGVWRNHNFTKAAQEGQKLVDEIKCKNKQNTTE